jgi:phosphopentomutase
MKFNRVVVIVLDGVGAGAAPDADVYGDLGSNSLGNTATAIGGLHLPNFEKFGLGYITPIQGVEPIPAPGGAFGKLQPKSSGKDTISGHWELMGIYLPKPFPTYPDGFPQDVLDEFKKRTGYDVLGNIAASGTEIIQTYGLEHIRTGKPILYTSADSVFQIAAHEEVIPIEKLYRLCEISREMLTGKHAVGRVIARPFLGTKPGEFKRTENRRDYPLLPPGRTILQKLVDAGKEVYSVGKIDDIFAHTGITKSYHSENNKDALASLFEILPMTFEGMVFVNLIEFDMIYGHRNDPVGYAGALQKVDAVIPRLRELMHPSDLIIFTADHGVDPTTPGTDHTREFVPLIVFGESVKSGINLGVRKTFGDVAATIAEIFSLPAPEIGISFLGEILESGGVSPAG